MSVKISAELRRVIQDASAVCDMEDAYIRAEMAKRAAALEIEIMSDSMVTVSYITEAGELLTSGVVPLSEANYTPGTIEVFSGHDHDHRMLITEVHVRGSILLRGRQGNYPESLFAPPQIWVVVEDVK